MCHDRTRMLSAQRTGDTRDRLNSPFRWRRWDSNPRPPACKAGALATELRPLDLCGSSEDPAVCTLSSRPCVVCSVKYGPTGRLDRRGTTGRPLGTSSTSSGVDGSTDGPLVVPVGRSAASLDGCSAVRTPEPPFAGNATGEPSVGRSGENGGRFKPQPLSHSPILWSLAPLWALIRYSAPLRPQDSHAMEWRHDV